MSEQCYRVIRSLEEHPSRLNKEAIVLAEAEAGNDTFFAGMRLAYDSMITFGVKKVPKHSGPDGQGLPWTAFAKLADDLATRKLTGDAAKKAIELCLSVATQAEWNDWYMRILTKDMRAGFTEGTINRVTEKKFPQYAIPVFSCQLAHDSANHESKVVGKKLIEVKLDGVRVITVVHPDGRVDQYSRNGKELVNFPHVKEQIAKVAHTFKSAMVLDGEIMSGTFQDLMKQIHRKSSATANDAVLNLFDIVTLDEFNAGGSKVAQTLRSHGLKTWFESNEAALPNVTVVAQELVDLDTDAGQARYKEINALAIAGGYEGIMLKDPGAGYVNKRTVAWMKLKPFIEVTLKAVAVEEGTGKNAGKMGAVLFEGTDDGKFIRVSVGGGWSDKDRDDIWANKDKVLDELGEVRADALTLNQDSTDVYSMRFPRFKTWRGFAAGEKL
jgi:DNA ligase-1